MSKSAEVKLVGKQFVVGCGDVEEVLCTIVRSNEVGSRCLDFGDGMELVVVLSVEDAASAAMESWQYTKLRDRVEATAQKMEREKAWFEAGL